MAKQITFLDERVFLDERGFTQVLVHKMHSSLIAQLHSLTQMQNYLAEVVATCKGLNRKESYPLSPHTLVPCPVFPVCPRPGPTLWVRCLQGKPKDEQQQKGSFLCFLFQVLYTCSFSGAITLVFTGLSF